MQGPPCVPGTTEQEDRKAQTYMERNVCPPPFPCASARMFVQEESQLNNKTHMSDAEGKSGIQYTKRKDWHQFILMRRFPSLIRITASLIGGQTDNCSSVVLGTLNFSSKNCEALYFLFKPKYIFIWDGRGCKEIALLILSMKNT